MTSLLDDAKRILELGYGDIPRLKHIKKTLEENKMLYISDRKYLYKLTQDNLEKTTTKTSQFDSEKIKYTTDENLEIEELEEKIRVDEEPS
jgi:regulator of replication initiation timing